MIDRLVRSTRSASLFGGTTNATPGGRHVDTHRIHAPPRLKHARCCRNPDSRSAMPRRFDANMTADRRRRSADRAHLRSGAAIPQLPQQRVRNPYPPMALLSADQVGGNPRSLHAHPGEFRHRGDEQARAGAVRESGGRGRPCHAKRAARSRIGRGRAQDHAAALPADAAQSRTNRAYRRRHDQLHAGGGAAQCSRHGTRPALPAILPTTATSVRLAQHFNCIPVLGNQVCAPVELAANSRRLDAYLANVALTDKSFHVSAIGRGRALDGIAMMAITRGLSLDRYAKTRP